MRLASYLAAHGLTYTAFGRLIGTPHARTVERYAKGLQPPNPAMLRRIHEATFGAVTPNDFFDFVPAAEVVASQEA